MTFIEEVQPEDASEEVQEIYRAGKKKYGVLFSNWKHLGHNTHMLRTYADFIVPVLNPEHLDYRSLELAIMKIAQLNRCPYCVSHHYHTGRRHGVTLDEMLALPQYNSYDGFSQRDRIAIRYAEELTVNPPIMTQSDEPHAVSEVTRAALKAEFSDAEIMELTYGIGLFNLLTRVNRMLKPTLDVPKPPKELMALIE